MNIENYLATLAAVEANPEHWNQREWCGTSHCFAGFAAALAGIEEAVVHRESVVARKACEFLGIAENSDWDSYLFDARRSLEDFRAVADALKSGNTVAPL
jgi:hypothetical protein